MCPNSAPPARSLGSRSIPASGQMCGTRSGRGLEHLDRDASGVGLLRLGDHRPHALPGDRVGDEDDPPVRVPGDADTAVRDAGNVELEFRHPDSVGGGLDTPLTRHSTRERQDPPVRLTLASTSPSRLQLLRMAGIEPVVVAPEVDEEAVAAEAGAQHDPRVLVELLAVAKAEAVAFGPGLDTLLPRHRGSSSAEGAYRDLDPRIAGLVLGCDSVFELDGVVYGKPHHPAVATDRWRRMRGRTGVLHTGHCLIEAATGDRGVAVVSTEVEFADVSDAEIDWYVATGEPLPVAGAFTLEGLAAPFITRVNGDPHSVVGLSLAALRELALGLGVDWPDLVARERHH